MSEEKMKVLEMLKDGKITTDEALKLLQRLPDQKETENRSNERYKNDSAENYDWVEDIKETVSKTAQNIAEYVKNQDFFDDISGTGKTEYYFAESEDIPQYIESLSIAGKNAEVSIKGYNGRSIQIEARYKTRYNKEPVFEFEGVNGHYSLIYDESAVRYVSLDVKVPNVHVGHLMAENKNSVIRIEHMHPVKADISTKNASIHLDDLSGKVIFAETKNASIKIDNLEYDEMKIKTTNAKITLDSVTSQEARLITTNASINVNDSDITWLDLGTTNASIKVHCNYDKFASYSVTGHSTNGNIKIAVPEKGFAYKIKASTTMGKIKNNLPNLIINSKIQDCNYLDALSTDFEQSDNKFFLDFSTTNGSVKINN